MVKMKICNHCKEEKPATSEYFNKDKGKKDGFNYRCKVCEAKYKKEYAAKNKEKIAEYKREYQQKNKEKLKITSKLKYEKNKEKYAETKKKYYREHKKEAAEYSKKYRADNSKDLSDKKRQYYEKNRDILKEKSAQHYNENREYALEQMKQHRLECPEVRNKWLSENKERMLNYNRQYRKEHPESSRKWSQERKARIKRLPATLTPEQWMKIKIDFGNSCCYCGKHESEIDHPIEQEHFIPLFHGGEYTHDNIIPSCKSCNSSKNNKDFFEWYPGRPYYSKQREQKILAYLNYSDNQQQLSIL